MIRDEDHWDDHDEPPDDEDDWEAADFESEIGEAADDYEAMSQEDEEETHRLHELTGGAYDGAELDPEERRELIDHLTEEEYEAFIANHGSPQPAALPEGKPYNAWCWGPHHARLSEKTHVCCCENADGRRTCGWLICHCGKCWCKMPDEMKARYSVRPDRIPEAEGPCPSCKGRPFRLNNGVGSWCDSCEGRGYRLKPPLAPSSQDEFEIPF